MSMRASAARYARALFDVASTESTPEQAEKDLTAFGDVFTGHAELQRTLVNPAVPLQGKRALVQQLLERLQPVSPVRKLLLLLAERDRFELVPDLVAVFHEHVMEYRKVVKAEVTTAAPLTPERIAELRHRLAAATGRTVDVTTKVDPALIGGMVTRIGSTVYDGSVAMQLAALRQRLSQQ
jgi:F-type H+-transporting ATPase subunit delta